VLKLCEVERAQRAMTEEGEGGFEPEDRARSAKVERLKPT